MSIATAAVLTVLILAGTICLTLTLICLTLIRGWVEVRRINAHTSTNQLPLNPAQDPTANGTKPGVADHPMFHRK